MSTVTVSRLKLEDGDLPPVCIKTGTRPDGTVDVRFSSLPSWTYLLLFAGVFPFLIALVFANEVVRGQVPIREPVVRRFHELGRRALLCFGIAAVCSVVAVIGVEWMWAAAGLAAFAGAFIRMQQAAGWVRARPVRYTALVELSGVSEEFAAAVTRERTAS
jgi:hypothetical protein